MEHTILNNNTMWDEAIIKEVIRKTLSYMAANPGEYETDKLTILVEHIYEYIKEDFDNWQMVAGAIEKYQDYINEQTNASETIIDKWGEHNMSDGRHTDIDGIKMVIDVKKK